MKISYGQSILRRMVKHLTGGAQIIDNYRPAWLKGLEIDIWLPRFNMGFEFDGDQHRLPVFGAKCFVDQMARDVIKEEILFKEKVVVVRVEAHCLSCQKIEHIVRQSYYDIFSTALGHDAATRKARKLARAIFPSSVIRSEQDDLDRQAKAYTQILRDKFLAPSGFSDSGDRRILISAAHKKMGRSSIRKMRRCFALRRKIKRSIRSDSNFGLQVEAASKVTSDDSWLDDYEKLIQMVVCGR